MKLRLAWLLVILTALACSAPIEEPFPSRPIEMVIAFPPGGVTDLAGRIFADGLAKGLKVPVVPTNKGGGSGVLGATVALQGRRDGYTFLANSVSGMVLGPAIMKDVSFSADRDFSPIALILVAPNSLIVAPDSPFKTLDDVITAARQQPGRLAYASSGTGTDGHFNAEIFLSAANLKVKHVPFTGGGELAAAVMGRHVDFGVGSITSYYALSLAGKVRTLAVTGHTRLKTLPNTPTFEELGVAGEFVDSWVGAFVPAGVPKVAVDKLVEVAARVAQSPEFAMRIEKIGGVVPSTSPAQFAAMIHAQQRMAATIAVRVGIVQSDR